MTPAEMQEWRARLGITQARAAELLGVGETTVRNWEAPPGAPRHRSIPEPVARLCGYVERERAR